MAFITTRCKKHQVDRAIYRGNKPTVTVNYFPLGNLLISDTVHFYKIVTFFFNLQTILPSLKLSCIVCGHGSANLLIYVFFILFNKQTIPSDTETENILHTVRLNLYNVHETEEILVQNNKLSKYPRKLFYKVPFHVKLIFIRKTT